MASLATRFGRNVNVLRAESPLSEAQIRQVAPSIFASSKHQSRSARYAYIATADVLQGLQREGFEPFMVAQARVRDEGKRDYTKHMLRLRHPTQINGPEANEVILLNSHDGTTSYQMLAGLFRFVCCNGMVCGDVQSDLRIPHKGDVVDRVVEGAFDVLDGFTRVVEERDAMKALALSPAEQGAFARAALQLKYDTDAAPAPVTEDQLLLARRFEDRGGDLWTTFNRVQENLVSGGLPGRSKTGRSIRTRGVTGIDQGVKLNRALWVLAEEMRRIRG